MQIQFNHSLKEIACAVRMNDEREKWSDLPARVRREATYRMHSYNSLFRMLDGRLVGFGLLPDSSTGKHFYGLWDFTNSVAIWRQDKKPVYENTCKMHRVPCAGGAVREIFEMSLDKSVVWWDLREGWLCSRRHEESWQIARDRRMVRVHDGNVWAVHMEDPSLEWSHVEPGWEPVTGGTYRLHVSLEDDIVLALYERPGKGLKKLDYVALAANGTLLARGSLKRHRLDPDSVELVAGGFGLKKRWQMHSPKRKGPDFGYLLILPRERQHARTQLVSDFLLSAARQRCKGITVKSCDARVGPWTVEIDAFRGPPQPGLWHHKSSNLVVKHEGKIAAYLDGTLFSVKQAHPTAGKLVLQCGDRQIRELALPQPLTLFARCGGKLARRTGGAKFERLASLVCEDVWEVLRFYKDT